MRSKFIRVIALFCVAAAALGMGRKEAPEREEHPPKPVQGVSGRVEIWEGDFMPMVDPKSPNHSVTPGAGRHVRLHEPLRMSGGMAAARHDSIPTPLVGEAVCGDDGAFFLAVRPGVYSIFVEDEGGWYFNGFNGEGIQGAVTVEEGQVTDVLIKVTSKATF